MDKMNYLMQIMERRGYKDGNKIYYSLISRDTMIPERTLRSWFNNERKPAEWVLHLLISYLS